jgi:hypothetical protein
VKICVICEKYFPQSRNESATTQSSLLICENPCLNDFSRAGV